MTLMAIKTKIKSSEFNSKEANLIKMQTMRFNWGNCKIKRTNMQHKILRKQK